MGRSTRLHEEAEKRYWRNHWHGRMLERGADDPRLRRSYYPGYHRKFSSPEDEYQWMINHENLIFEEIEQEAIRQSVKDMIEEDNLREQNWLRDHPLPGKPGGGFRKKLDKTNYLYQINKPKPMRGFWRQ